MRGGVALGVLLVILLSGCTVKEPDAEAQVDAALSSSTSTSQSATTSSSTSTSSGPADSVQDNETETPNLAPSAGLTASAASGTAPFNVTFALTGADPEEAPLNWTLMSANLTLGTGTSLPANVSHEFAAGNYTIVLTVTDGTNEAIANVTLQVSAPEVPDVPEVPNPCPTDAEAVSIPGGYYLTPMDSAQDPPFSIGSLWIYEESNGMPGLQRNDDTDPHPECLTPDTIIL